MKKIYFLFVFLLSTVIFGQNINFPDANLKAKLLSFNPSQPNVINIAGYPIAIDANGDGEIQIAEAAVVKKLKFSSVGNITNLSGLELFSQLTELEISYCTFSLGIILNNYPSLQQLNIYSSSFGSLEILNCNSLIKANIDELSTANFVNIQSSSIEEIVLYGSNTFAVNTASLVCPNLKKFDLKKTNLTSLNLNNAPILTDINVKNNPLLTSVDFSGCIGIKNIDLENNKLSSLSLPNPTIIDRLYFANNLFTSFDPSPYTNMWYFIAEDNQISSLDFTNNQFIKGIYVKNNQLTSIILNNNNNLNLFDVSNNLLTSISFGTSPITTFTGNNNLFSTIDFSKRYGQLTFNVSNNPNLQQINLKNGYHNFSGSSNGFYENTPNLHYICADENEFVPISNYNNYINSNAVIGSYCSFTPTGNYSILQGTTQYDTNTNGCDPLDQKKQFQKFKIYNSLTTTNLISNSSGDYILPLQYGPHTITPILENPTYFNISPTSFNLNFPTQASPLNQNFCLTANGNHNDLEVVVIPVTAAVPGFTSKYKILYKNKGTGTQSGILNFNYNSNLSSFLTSSFAPTSQSAGVLNYNFTNLLPFESREILVTLQLNTPTQNPPLNGGAVLNFAAQINGATDETPLDNNFALNQTVVNSFDPNDKTCLEGTAITQTKVGDYVHYLIRFENTGTANAQNIVVKDMIDTAKFDINSLVAMNGSHSFVTRITNPNTVEFIFENIQLPFANATNDGYVSFKIKTKSTLVLGDSFSNTANIYFDYNAPIVTNTYTTTVANILGTQENVLSESLNFYPNPVDDIIYFKSDEKLLKLEIYDVSGRIVGSVTVQNNEANLSFLKTGNYLLKIFTKDKFFVNKIVKK